MSVSFRTNNSVNSIKSLHQFYADCDEKAMQSVLIKREVEQRYSEYFKHLADKINLMEAKYDLEVTDSNVKKIMITCSV